MGKMTEMMKQMGMEGEAPDEETMRKAMSMLSQKGTGRGRGKGGRGGVPDMDQLMSMLGNMES
jgi:hypothetical protein